MKNTKQIDEINNNNESVKPKKTSSDALKRQRLNTIYIYKKLDKAYVQDMRNRAFKYYHEMKQYELKKIY